MIPKNSILYWVVISLFYCIAFWAAWIVACQLTDRKPLLEQKDPLQIGRLFRRKMAEDTQVVYKGKPKK